MTAHTHHPTRVLAVANSDSYLKWAAATLDGACEPEPESVETRLVVIQGPALPTPPQLAAALIGSAAQSAPVVSPSGLKALVREFDPDVVLVAATGPAAQNVARLVVRATATTGRRPALVTGFPGIGLPVTRAGTSWRRWCDAFVAHGPREAEAYTRAFRRRGVAPRIVVAPLPFLGAPLPEVLPVRRIVFATQARVPSLQADRRHVLSALSGLADDGFDVVVKNRTTTGERQTHHEEHPYEELWSEVRHDLARPADHLRFVTGPMAHWLTPDSALVTVSSTAALEAMALGLQTAFIEDFGVSRGLLNEVYADSMCLVSTAELAKRLRADALHPSKEWLADTYLWSHPSELSAALRDLTAARRTGTLAPLRTVRLYRRVEHFHAATTAWQPRLVPVFAWMTRCLRVIEQTVSRIKRCFPSWRS